MARSIDVVGAVLVYDGRSYGTVVLDPIVATRPHKI